MLCKEAGHTACLSPSPLQAWKQACLCFFECELQVEPTQSVRKYKCPLHFYSADQGLAVQSFLGQHAREALESRVSLKKAHSAFSHVTFWRAREDNQKKNGTTAKARLLSFNAKTQKYKLFI